jgi:hypothetical protein
MLTNEQIQSLFTFCEKHFVKYYDVQVELVDHLANAVEEKMTADSTLTFEKALEKVHQSFGVMGFAPLVAEKAKMAEKQSRGLFWRLFKEQFKWPKIILSFLLTAVFFTIFSTDLIPIKGTFATIIIAGCYFELYKTIKINRAISKTGKKFLLGGISQFVGFAWLPIYLFLYPNMLDEDLLSNVHSALSIFFLSIFLSLFIILIIALWQTFSSVKSALHKNYPEIFSIS